MKTLARVVYWTMRIAFTVAVIAFGLMCCLLTVAFVMACGWKVLLIPAALGVIVLLVHLFIWAEDNR